MKQFLLAVLCVANTAIAAPVEDAAGVDFDRTKDLQAAVDDVEKLDHDLVKYLDGAKDAIGKGHAKTAFGTFKFPKPFIISKRQTSVDVSVEHGPNGNMGRADVNHKDGDTTYNGNISRGPGGTSYGVGISHKSKDFNVGVDVNKNKYGTSANIGLGKTWNDGNTNIGVFGGRDSSGGSYGGLRFSHQW